MKGLSKKIVIYLCFFCLSLEVMAYLHSAAEKVLRPPFTSIFYTDSLGLRGVKYGRWNNIRLNKYGFHDSDDYDKQYKKRAVRIMCLGDSITFGTFSAPHNWPNFLEEKLRIEGLDVEVINTAIPGNSFIQLIERFEKEYLNFRPDIVIIYKGFRHYMGPKLSIEAHRWKFVRLLEKSAFIRKRLNHLPLDPYKRLLMSRKKSGVKELIKNITEEHLAEYRKDLERLIRVCRDNNILLVLSYFPTLVDQNNKDRYIEDIYDVLYFYPSVSVDAYIDGIPKFNAVTKDVAMKEGLVYVDISKGLERNREFFRDDYHLTVKAAKQVAENYTIALLYLLKVQFPTAMVNVRDDSAVISFEER